MYYAQLNENNICTGISRLSGKVEDKYMIEILNLSSDYIWHKYVFETNTWSEEKYEPESSAQLSEFEQVKKNNEILAKTVANLTTENKKKDLFLNQLAQSTANLNIELNKLKGGM